MSTDVLLIQVTKLLRSLNLGILILDDVQNVLTAKSNVSKKVVNFMVALINYLRIPIVMIGTPIVRKLFQADFQLAKRVSGEGEIRMNLMEEKSPEWDNFLKVLWRYQFTANHIELTSNIKEAFFYESAGNPFIAAILYKIVQDDAIINNAESFNVNNIHEVAERTLGLTAQKRKDMLDGKDVELNSYKYLWAAHTISK